MDFMKDAIKEAKKSLQDGEVPIGAVIVQNGKIIARGRNSREKTQNAINHAEIVAISRACKKLKSWRLDDCEMFVTLEPCPMCSGAIANARLKCVTYACPEKTSGDHLCETILQSDRLNHHTKIVQDKTHEEECSTLLTNMFKQKR